MKVEANINAPAPRLELGESKNSQASSRQSCDASQHLGFSCRTLGFTAYGHQSRRVNAKRVDAVAFAH